MRSFEMEIQFKVDFAKYFNIFEGKLKLLFEKV